MQEFKYCNKNVYEKSLLLDDYGNCAIESVDDMGEYSYLIIFTKLGQSYILTQESIVPDIEKLPNNVITTYLQMEFNEKKVKQIINKFLFKKVSAIEIPIDNALQLCKNVIEYYKKEWKN